MVQTLSACFLVVSLAAIVAFHLYWFFGGRRLADLVIPTRVEDGMKLFQPSGVAVLIVAAYLSVILVLAVCVYYDIRLVIDTVVSGYLLLAAGAIFVLRAIGDFRYIGFTKRVRGTRFSVADDRLFSPLVLALGLACFMVVLAS